MNYKLFILFLSLIIIFTQIYTLPINIYQSNEIEGGAISHVVGPVDMLQMPKQLLMDGYRFQNCMFPPKDIRECDPNIRQRVGMFKDISYINQEGGYYSPYEKPR